VDIEPPRHTLAAAAGPGGEHFGDHGFQALQNGERTRVMQNPATSRPVDFRVDDARVRGDAVVLALHGEVDLHAAPELRERLAATIDGGAPAVLVDLSDVTFVDSTALGVLVGAMKRLRATRRPLRLVAPRPDVRRLLEITLLDRVLGIDATTEDALAAVAPGSGRF
jgi:anti-sigma B factor antagonist